MNFNKRDFLKLAGLGIVGAIAKPAVEVFGAGAVPNIAANVKKNPKALVGKKWAMVVDMRACKAHEGCRACIDVCHTTHNVPNWITPDGKPDIKNEVKWIWTEKFGNAFPEQEHHFVKGNLREMPFIVMCNHCTNPSCVRVCPTQATWKREDGIVMMDMHRCIGCRFCMAACPYGSRSFNWRDPRKAIGYPLNPNYPTRQKGVVEKCTFCAERLAEGLLPACVEKCKEINVSALHFGDLEREGDEIRNILYNNYTIRRKPEIGTSPEVYYIV